MKPAGASDERLMPRESSPAGSLRRLCRPAAGAALILLLLFSGPGVPLEARPGPGRQLSGAAARQFLAQQGILEQLPAGGDVTIPAQGRSFTEGQPLTPAESAEGDSVGLAVALDGDTLAVSAHRAAGPGGAEQGAVYIFTRQPGVNGSTWSEEQLLRAGDGAANDHFGSALALDGDTLLVGAPEANIGGDVDQGAAYVFDYAGGVWSEAQKLTAAGGSAGDNFGFSLALDGDNAILGAYRAEVGGNAEQGAAYLFTRNGSGWSEQAQLSAAGGAPFDHFGFSTALNGAYALVGAPDAEVAGEDEQGAAYLFQDAGASWSEQQRLTAGDGAAGDQFGGSVALEDGSALVGAPAAAVDGHPMQGAAYHFSPDAGGWSERQKLTAGDGAADDSFGSCLAPAGDTLVVCAYGVEAGGNSSQGAAYIFTRRDQGLWAEQQKLLARDGAAEDFFGISAAIDQDTAMVGAYLADAGGLEDAGKVYLMERGPIPWPESSVNAPADGADGDNFGVSVALDGNTAVVGAYRHMVAGRPNQGAAYVFARNGGYWVQQQQLTAGDGGEDDYFGVSVALDGETLVVGAFRADVAGANRQGAVYVFTRAGGQWSEQQKLVAGDGTVGDQFGGSLALDADSLAVGAARADVAGKEDQGAVYAFTRGAAGWSEQQKLVAADGAAGAFLGRSLALEGDRLLAGAPGTADGANVEQGAAYFFSRSGFGAPWAEAQQLAAADGAAGDAFGEALAMAGGYALISAHLAGIGAADDQGAAYVFVLAGAVWSEEQKLVAVDGMAGDQFGYALALDEGRAVVGAILADVGGRPDRGAAYVYGLAGDEWAWEQKLPAGESTGGQGRANDYFGYAAALDGNTALLGAIWAGGSGDEGPGQVHFFSRDKLYLGHYLPALCNQTD